MIMVFLLIIDVIQSLTAMDSVCGPSKFICWNLILHVGFPGSSAGKESACNAGDPGLIPGLGSLPGKGILPTPVFMGFPGGSDG